MPTGAQQPYVTWGEYNNLIFAIQQALGKMQTSTVVRIDACTNAGDLSPVGFVDVTPLVNQVDAAGVPVPHITIFNIPYVRMQGGINAIIMDPAVGDIGMCVFASRDISKIKTTKAQANPGSFRQYNFADGMYLGGLLNAEPERFLQFNDDGVTLVSADGFSIDAETDLDGSINVTGNATIGNGASGSFLSYDEKIVTVQDGIVTNIF